MSTPHLTHQTIATHICHVAQLLQTPCFIYPPEFRFKKVVYKDCGATCFLEAGYVAVGEIMREVCRKPSMIPAPLQ